MRICVVGYGYWGPKLVRNFLSCGKHRCGVAVCDSHPEAISRIRKDYPNIDVYGDYRRMLDDQTVDAVVLATPIGTHFHLAKTALDAGKHVLVEKPLTASARDAEILCELSRSSGKILMVDHTFLYHPAVRYIKRVIDSGELGRLYYYDATRINLGLFQNDVNVFWDLAVHDISILNYLVGERPIGVSANGQSHLASGVENMGAITLSYDSGFFAHINCSWVSPVKIRHTLVGGDKKMVVYNDLDVSESVKIYDSGFSAVTTEDERLLRYGYRVGDVRSPHIAGGEALASVVEDFLDAISDKDRTPVSHASFAADVVRILEAVQESNAANGREVALSWPA